MIGETNLTLDGPSDVSFGTVAVYTGVLTGVDDSGTWVALPGEKVEILVDDVKTQEVPTDSYGFYSATVSFLTVGTHVLTVQYQGSSTTWGVVVGWDAYTTHRLQYQTLYPNCTFLWGQYSWDAHHSIYGLLSPSIPIGWATTMLGSNIWMGSYAQANQSPSGFVEWFIAEYGTDGQEVSRRWLGTDTVRLNDVIPTRKGGLLFAGHHQIYDAVTHLQFEYLSPSGVWTTIVHNVPPSSSGTIASNRMSLCQHPTDDGIFLFYKRDSYHWLDAVHLVETADGGIQVDWTITKYISDTVEGENAPEGEFPDIVAVQYDGDIILAYQCNLYQIFATTPTFQKGAYVAFWRISADGSKQFITRMEQWAERVMNIGVITTAGKAFAVIWPSGTPENWLIPFISRFDGANWLPPEPLGATQWAVGRSFVGIDTSGLGRYITCEPLTFHELM